MSEGATIVGIEVEGGEIPAVVPRAPVPHRHGRPASFDVVVAHGVLHHLDDTEASELFALARHALKPGGRLVTADGCYVTGQSRVVRYLLAFDRGAHARTEEGYRRLAREQFSSITTSIRHDVARVPYTMVYLTCRA